MAPPDSLSAIDDQLDALGSAPPDVTQRPDVQWARGATLSAIDQELEALSTGVSFVVTAPIAVSVPIERVAPVAPPAPPELPEPTNLFADDPIVTQAAAQVSVGPELTFETATPSMAPELSIVDAPTSIAPELSVVDAPFSPTLPSEPPPAVDTLPKDSKRPRVLTMSEPPMSEPPPSESVLAGDVDPFGDKPAPMPVPQRTPSVWPLAPAPKRSPAKTIRTSAAPPPPLPSASMRPRSVRPSDTPDPFAPLNRASSRPPASLDSDQLFGGISAAPPAGDAPVKLSAPPAPKLPARPPQAPNTVPAAAAAPEGEDFELLVDDEMLEIDVEEMDELD